MSILIGNQGNALELTIPSRADVNWDAIMQAALTVITTHNHDGVNNGTAVPVTTSQRFAITKLRSAAASLSSPSAINTCGSTGLTLSTGNWDVSGFVGFLSGTSTSVTKLIAAVSTTSATLPTSDFTGVPSGGQVVVTQEFGTLVSSASDTVLTIPTFRVAVVGTTTLYLVSAATFSASTLVTYGSLEARSMP